MRVVLAVMMGLVVSSAHAQGTAEQRSRCAALQTSADRDKCYDALAKSKAPSDQVFTEAVVEVRPEVVSGPALQYPDLLRQAGVQGRVIVQAILDTLGRAEPWSVNVIQSPNPGFDQAAKDYVLQALFRPARVHGRAVRVLVNVPIDFMIRPKRAPSEPPPS